MDGQHRVAAGRKLNLLNGYFNIISCHTPELLLLKFGTRNATTETQILQHAVSRAKWTDTEIRAKYASSTKETTFVEFARTMWNHLNPSTLDEVISIVELSPAAKQPL